MATIVFDVNETLSDPSPMRERFADVGAPRDWAATWFTATLRDGFALGTTGRAPTFRDVAKAVLLGMLHGLDSLDRSPDDAVEHILGGFLALGVHPDIAPGVRALAGAGHRLVTLSNGSVPIAERLLGEAGLRDAFDLLLSVDDVGVWKPHAQAYHYAAQRCGQPPGELVMVAVHPWDLHGARTAGLTTVMLDRTGAPWPAVFAEPDHHIGALPELLAALA